MAADRFSIGPPVWSSTSNWNPPNAPRPRIGGGRNGIASAPLMPPRSFPRSRATIAWADWDSLRRSSYGLSRMNRMARFGDAPEKLNPVTVNAAARSGSVSRIFSACRHMSLVYSRDAPSGACTWMMK